MLETTAEKYKEFAEQLEYRDTDIFVSIPCLMILKLLNGEDKNICRYFLPQLFDDNEASHKILMDLIDLYANWKNEHLKHY